MSTISALPTAPSPTDDTATFNTRAFAFLAALQTFRTETNTVAGEVQGNTDITAALALAIALPAYGGTSTDSITIGTGAKTFNTQAGKSWVAGQIVVVSNGSNYMKGTVTSYSTTTLAVNVTSIGGSGTFASWSIGLGFNSIPGLAASGANSDITSLTGLTTGISGTALGNKIQPITASVAANALTITLNPTTLDFRSATLTSGTVNTRAISSAISLTISSGSTLGTVSAQQSRIAVLAIDNAGTVELAAVNIAGGNDLSETGLITTTAEGGAGGADTANVIYSTTARTSVPYRVVGYVESTQATAGTWVTAPSTIQGYGGQAFAAMSSLGYGQTWQTPTRAVGTTYYVTGKPVQLNIRLDQTAGGAAEFRINGVNFQSLGGGVTGFPNFIQLVIPPGNSYAIINTGSPLTLVYWKEML